MSSFALDIVSLTLGFGLGALLVLCACLVYFLPRLAGLKKSQDDMGFEFSAIAQNVLSRSNEQFLTLAQERLTQKIHEAQKDSDFDLEKRQKAVADLVDPIGKSLKDMEQKIEGLGKAGAGLEAQLKHFTTDQKQLRDTTQALVMALKNPAARGRWGEMQLERILEQVGLRQGVHFDTQKHIVQDGAIQKPDFVVHMPNGVDIIIDVKTPMDSYWHYVDAIDDHDGDKHRAQFTAHVRGHVKQLGSKDYFRGFETTPEFVVMFLPSESLYALAIGSDQNLIEDAARANVILASPTTIMGLLRVIHYGWQQQNIAQEAKNIAGLAADLYRRLGAFGEHFVAIGSSLGKSVQVYNKAVGSLETSVLPLMRKFKDMDVQTAGKEIPEVKQIEDLERRVSAIEFKPADDAAA